MAASPLRLLLPWYVGHALVSGTLLAAVRDGEAAGGADVAAVRGSEAVGLVSADELPELQAATASTAATVASNLS